VNAKNSDPPTQCQAYTSFYDENRFGCQAYTSFCDDIWFVS